MKLHYHDSGYFTLTCPHVPAQEILAVHGLQLSSQRTDDNQAIMFTREPFAAVAFFEHGTPEARAKLLGLHNRIQASRAVGSARHFEIPPGRELWPFQQGTVAYALDGNSHAASCDEPGLGKTAEAIVLANTMGAQRIKVICPASIRLQWAERIRQWSTIPNVRVSTITTSRRGVPPNIAGIHYTVVSYDIAGIPAIQRALNNERYDLLIIDEAHYAKTGTARRSEAIFGGAAVSGIAEQAERIFALTGTPLPNRPSEAYTLIRGLCWDAADWCSRSAFEQRFCSRTIQLTGDGRPFIEEEVNRLPELQARLRGTFMARHLKADVMDQLRPPVYDLIYALETGPVRQALEAERLLDIDPSNLGGSGDKLGAIATARKLMGLALAPQAVDYVKMLLEGGEHKIVVFGWHRQVLDILEKGLEKYGVLRVDGSTSALAKQLRCSNFIVDPRYEILLGNLLSLGTGTDGLQEVANRAFLAEPDWVPGTIQQCVDRLSRGGQNRTVFADIMVAPRSLAAMILGTALNKLTNIHTALDEEHHVDHQW